MMSCFLLSVWRSSLILCLGQLLRCGEARVKTEVQAGPLYRVLGSPLYITCSVSGFRSENTDKHFEFRMTKPSNPNFEIQIISSNDDNFGYSNHQSRVRKNEIALKRLSPNSVRFEIKSLLKDDEGEYECTAVNLEGAYDGEYSAKTVVKVIEDSLSVSSSASTPLSLNEGEALTLTCLASSSTSQHTHLSVAWYLHKDGQEDAQPIISLNRDFTLSPGQGFERRYQAGLIRLDKLGEATYNLQIAKVEPSDRGRIYCQAQEWIQDPDGSWYIIIQKIAEEMTLTVKATEVVEPSSPSLAVEISAQPAALQEGQELMLSCDINTQDVEKRFFSVAWLKGSVELARIGPTGVLTVAPVYSVRQKNGELRAARSGNGNYRLILKPVRTEDQGEYTCRVWPQERGQDDAFIEGEAKDSSPQRVSISTTENRLTVKMQQAVNVAEGGGLHLSCKVDGVQGQLSVTWQLKSARMASFTNIISISQEGVTEIAEEFMSRKVRVMRPATHNFTLELDEVTLSDSGVYQCAVSDRKPNGKTHSQTQTTTVTVISIENRLSVKMQPAGNVAEGGGLHLSCKVDGVQGQLSVTWEQKSASMALFTKIISINEEGVTEIAEEFMSRKVSVMRPTTDNFTLELDEVTLSDSGVYQCAVSERKPNGKTHNQAQTTTVTVISIDTLMEVSLISRKNQVTVGEKLELMCRVRGPHMPVTVTWSVQREAKTPDTILTLSPDGTISWSGDQNHYQLRVESRKTEVIYYLLVIGTSHREGGNYQCNVSVLLKNVHKELKASNQLAVIVNNPVSRLDVSPIPALTRNMNTDITIKCSIVTKTSESSLYSITWLHEENAGNKTIVSLDRNSIVTESQTDLSQRISMRRSTGPTFELTIRQARISDKGSYTCKVGEWLQDPRGEWYLLSTVSKSTVLTITEPANDLRLDKKEQQLTAKEGEEVELNCNITSGASGSSVFYGVIWRYAAHSSSLKNASLVELDHTGLVSYPDNKDIRGLQERLRLSRPTQKSFYLSIQKAHEEDSGTYWCQVDQYQLDNKAHWQLKASDSGGAIKLSVKVTENNLSIPKEEVSRNISRNQDLTISCNINKQSSHESKFQVTWFWKKEIETKQRPIFTVYRNSTLQHRFEENVRLRYDHPDPSQFSLTFLNPGPENSGLYFCEVEEWLPSLSRGWRKVAVEKSGHFNVSVLTEGDANAVSECNTTTYTIVIVVLIIIVVVILLLMFKVCRSKGSQGKKSTPSLWAESLPMNNKPSGDD
ncbi:immunoglobulin superfamily member 3-like isoform X1 [Oreochromis aureus]|uniref:immunoglobulin superfamily member 3-like isoform X1 n=1 Tax=Oreochromis aureus TaxID=47969 RepID=UPI001954696E|nr:immunoglobulin superfamily member 3-like isoform X1 [Oreochromis aureus]